MEINDIGTRSANNLLRLVGMALVSEENVRHRTADRADFLRPPAFECAISPLGPLLESSRDERINQNVVAVGHMIVDHRDKRIETSVKIAKIENEVILKIGARTVRIV